MILDRLFRASGHVAQITTPEELERYLAGRSRSAAGVSVTPERAMTYSAVFSCVRVLAESVGQLPLHLYRQQGREKVKAQDHPLYGLLHDAPNEYMTAQEYKEWVVSCLALRGNAYSQINRVGVGKRSSVKELLPFPVGAVTPKRNPETLEVTYEVALADGTSETLSSAEVLHHKLFPLDGLCGANPLRYARETVGLGIGAEMYGATLFANGASPGGVLEHPKSLTEGAYERLKTSWEERHQGAENAHRVAILEEGMKYAKIGMDAKDAQFLETRQFSRSEVCGIWRVPPHLIADLEHATFSNIEHQGLEFVVHGLMPYLVRIEQRAHLQLLTPAERREYFFRFQVAGLLRGDMAARSEYYTKQLANGALSPNEIRDLEDQNPRDGGDIYLTPANMLINGEQPPSRDGAPAAEPAPVARPRLVPEAKGSR
jgi:HK97 family phage portal protein